MAIQDKKRTYRKSLRNANINYRNGWFFVTSQVAKNKSMFGAIVGEECVLNEFGKAVRDYWLSLPAKYPELGLIEDILMPNHFHAVVRIRYRPSNREHHLGFIMGRFKGGTGYIYGKCKAAGKVEDIGAHLWQFDCWDNLVTSEDELAKTCAAGRALLLSPQPPGSRLNKKVATWCNEYVLRHASEVWVGDISPNGMLSAMLQGLGLGLGLKPHAPILKR